MSKDDLDLARRAAAGDRAAFEDIYKRYFPDVWYVARGRLREGCAAEEVVQDTFTRAFRSLQAFRGPNLRGWLRQICEHLCVDHQKRQMRREQLAPTGVLDERYLLTFTGKADDEDAIIERGLFNTALRKLSSDQRDAYIKVRVYGYTAQEVADQRGVAASTVRSQVSAARKRLYQILQPEESLQGEGVRHKNHAPAPPAPSPLREPAWGRSQELGLGRDDEQGPS